MHHELMIFFQILLEAQAEFGVFPLSLSSFVLEMPYRGWSATLKPWVISSKNWNFEMYKLFGPTVGCNRNFWRMIFEWDFLRQGSVRRCFFFWKVRLKQYCTWRWPSIYVWLAFSIGWWFEIFTNGKWLEITISIHLLKLSLFGVPGRNQQLGQSFVMKWNSQNLGLEDVFHPD